MIDIVAPEITVIVRILDDPLLGLSHRVVKEYNSRSLRISCTFHDGAIVVVVISELLWCLPFYSWMLC